jgi:hypothetical protein
MNIRLSLFEVFLLQTVGWLGLWLFSDYVAGLLTIIVGAVVSAALLIALIAEAIERSKVPKSYFYVMALSLLAMLVAAGLYRAIASF